MEHLDPAGARARQVRRLRLRHHRRDALGGRTDCGGRRRQPLSGADHQPEPGLSGRLPGELCRRRHRAARARRAGGGVRGQRGQHRERSRQLPWRARGRGGPSRRHQGRLQQSRSRGCAERARRELRQRGCRTAVPVLDRYHHRYRAFRARGSCLQRSVQFQRRHELLGAHRGGCGRTDALRECAPRPGVAHRATRSVDDAVPGAGHATGRRHLSRAPRTDGYPDCGMRVHDEHLWRRHAERRGCGERGVAPHRRDRAPGQRHAGTGAIARWLDERRGLRSHAEHLHVERRAGEPGGTTDHGRGSGRGQRAGAHKWQLHPAAHDHGRQRSAGFRRCHRDSDERFDHGRCAARRQRLSHTDYRRADAAGRRRGWWRR